MESELKRKGNRQQEQHLCKQLNSFITLIHYCENWMQFYWENHKGRRSYMGR